MLTLQEGMYANLRKIGLVKRRTFYAANMEAAFWDRMEGKL